MPVPAHGLIGQAPAQQTAKVTVHPTKVTVKTHVGGDDPSGYTEVIEDDGTIVVQHNDGSTETYLPSGIKVTSGPGGQIVSQEPWVAYTESATGRTVYVPHTTGQSTGAALAQWQKQQQRAATAKWLIPAGIAVALGVIWWVRR